MEGGIDFLFGRHMYTDLSLEFGLAVDRAAVGIRWEMGEKGFCVSCDRSRTAVPGRQHWEEVSTCRSRASAVSVLVIGTGATATPDPWHFPERRFRANFRMTTRSLSAWRICNESDTRAPAGRMSRFTPGSCALRKSLLLRHRPGLVASHASISRRRSARNFACRSILATAASTLCRALAGISFSA